VNWWMGGYIFSPLPPPLSVVLSSQPTLLLPSLEWKTPHKMTIMNRLLTFKGLDLVGYGILLGTLYYVGLVIRRLFFHPLSKFPGPRLAAATRWYEFYDDVILGGVTSQRYPALHKRYGMHCDVYRCHALLSQA